MIYIFKKEAFDEICVMDVVTHISLVYLLAAGTQFLGSETFELAAAEPSAAAAESG